MKGKSHNEVKINDDEEGTGTCIRKDVCLDAVISKLDCSDATLV